MKGIFHKFALYVDKYEKHACNWHKLNTKNNNLFIFQVFSTTVLWNWYQPIGFNVLLNKGNYSVKQRLFEESLLMQLAHLFSPIEWIN